MTAKEYYNSTRMIPTTKWSLEMAMNFAEEYSQYLRANTDRFKPPTDNQMIDIAILFNNGKLEPQKLSDMLAYGQFVVDRLFENGDIGIPSSKED